MTRTLSRHTPAARNDGGRLASRRGGTMTGCLIALAVVLLLIIGGVVFVAVSWRGWVAGWGSQAAITFVNNSDLPDEEKAEVIAQIEGLAADFESGKLSVADMGQILEALTESPLVPAAIVYGAQTEYFEPSGLSDEEKAAGELALTRLANGVFDESIPPETLEDVFGPIEGGRPGDDGVHINNPDLRLNLKPPQDCTDEELRQVIANAAAAADEAGVPETPPSIDVSDEVQKAIDSVTGGAAEHDDAHDDPGGEPHPEESPEGP